MHLLCLETLNYFIELEHFKTILLSIFLFAPRLGSVKKPALSDLSNESLPGDNLDKIGNIISSLENLEDIAFAGYQWNFQITPHFSSRMMMR